MSEQERINLFILKSIHKLSEALMYDENNMGASKVSIDELKDIHDVAYIEINQLERW